MAIIVNLDVVLAQRKMRLNTLAELVDITPQNLSVLKSGRAKAIRFDTLEKICEVLQCQPGDILAYDKNAPGVTPGDADTSSVDHP
jgi:putative transcriptional regulator